MEIKEKCKNNRPDPAAWAWMGGVMKSARQNAGGKKTYVGEDGYPHCAVCHEPLEVPFSTKTMFGATHPQMCRCDREESIRREEERKRMAIANARFDCFKDFPRGEKGRFALDGCPESRLSQLVKRYATGFRRVLPLGSGLLICGGCGAGKTFYAEAVCNQLCDDGFHPRFTTLPALYREQTSAATKDRNALLKELTRSDLVVLDDFGTEGRNAQMKSFLFDVVDALYKAGTPFLITTNLPLSAFAEPEDEEFRRISERILERCPLRWEVPPDAVNMRLRRTRQNQVELLAALNGEG